MQHYLTPELMSTILGWAACVVAVVQWVRERRLLPARVQGIIDRVGIEQWAGWIERAGTFSRMTNEERRDWVLHRVTQYLDAQEELLPDLGPLAVAHEAVYQRTKGRGL